MEEAFENFPTRLIIFFKHQFQIYNKEIQSYFLL